MINANCQCFQVAQKKIIRLTMYAYLEHGPVLTGLSWVNHTTELQRPDCQYHIHSMIPLSNNELRLTCCLKTDNLRHTQVMQENLNNCVSYRMA